MWSGREQSNENCSIPPRIYSALYHLAKEADDNLNDDI